MLISQVHHLPEEGDSNLREALMHGASESLERCEAECLSINNEYRPGEGLQFIRGFGGGVSSTGVCMQGPLTVAPRQSFLASPI
jgi:hypothetical protein